MKKITVAVYSIMSLAFDQASAQEAGSASPESPSEMVQIEGDAEQVFDRSSAKLEDIIECKIGVPTYNGFVLWFHGNKKARKFFGLTPIKGGGNPFLSEYRLAKPITVFGQTTSHIAFSSSALLAVLSGVTPQQMADQLKVRDGGDFMGKYLAEKVVSEERIDEKDLDLHATQRITLNVSTVSSHPDRVLVGCSYRTTFDDD